jgi:protein subunit release factor B
MKKWATDRGSLEGDCDLDLLRAGGPGGQHANKRETGVRLRHRGSGLLVVATERRSQYQNRELAFERMAERLEEAQRVEIPRVATRPTRASVRRRLHEKRQNSVKKQDRRGGPGED